MNTDVAGMAVSDHSSFSVSAAFQCFGARILIQSNDDALPRDLVPFLPPGSIPIEPGEADAKLGVAWNAKRGLYCTHDGATLRFYRSLEDLSNIFHLMVATYAKPYVFIHAGVVGMNGHAILLPGRSMTGKSTLTSALVEAGATYFSDEYAVLDSTGCVHAYRKPLTLRLSGERHRRFEMLGSQAAKPDESMVTGLIAFTIYKSDARWHPRRLTPAEAVLALFDNTVAAQSRAEALFPILSQLVQRPITIKGSRPDISITVPALMRLSCKHSETLVDGSI